MRSLWRFRRWFKPRTWPLAVRVPAVVVLLMLIVSAVISERVLSRLIDTQKRQLSELTSAYLDGVSSAVLPHVLREDVWEVYDVLDRAAKRNAGLDIAWTTITLPNGTILASSKPTKYPTQQLLPSNVRNHGLAKTVLRTIPDQGIARFTRELVQQGRKVGIVVGEIRIGKLIDERWSVLMTLILTNAALTLILALAGYLMIRRMLRPVSLLADHMRVDPDGDFVQIPVHLLGRPQSEFGQLFRRYNALVATVRERHSLIQTLAEEERLASLGRLASGMAHEINNPLGGMLNALQTLKRHGARDDVRINSADLIERGLLGIRNVVRSALATYRSEPDQDQLTPQDLDDLAVLIRPEAKLRSIRLVWQNEIDFSLPIPAHPVRDAALNLLLNACQVSPDRGEVIFTSVVDRDTLHIAVGDRGPGLPEHLKAFLLHAGDSGPPATDSSRLGLWIVRRIVTDLSGTIAVEDRDGGGSVVRMVLPLRLGSSQTERLQESRYVA